MRSFRRPSSSLFPAVLAASFLGLVAGCLFIDNPNQLAPGTGGAGGAGGADDGGAEAATPPTDGPTVCSKYGGYAGAEAIVGDLMTTLDADCRISPFFTTLDSTQQGHLHDCTVKQVAVLMQCPGIRYDVDNSGVACRDMQAAHAGLGIRADDFNAFLDDMATAFHTAGVDAADVDSMIGALHFLQSDVEDNSAPGLSKSICPGGGGS
jgi:hypothetical protein